MSEFNLADMLADIVPDPGTGAESLQYIAHDCILPDENNGYSMDGLDDLARSIEIAGLQQPIRVRPIEGEPGRYRILSGHRRHAAIGKLIENGSKLYADGVPCIVDSSEMSEALQELKLLLANADNRKLTAADELQQAERISDCIRRLEDEGFEFPGRHRDWVAKLSGMSRTKLGRLNAIKNNLHPVLLRAFRNRQINETVADLLQKLPKEGQEAINEYCNRAGKYDALNSSAAEHCVKYAEKFMAPCKCGDGEDCDHHEKRFVQPFRTSYHWQYCDGGCCLSCSQLLNCNSACRKGQEKQKTVKAETKAEKEKAEKNRNAAEKAQQTRFKKARQAEAQRVLPAIDAAGLDDDFQLTGRYGYNKIKVGEIRKAAAADFGDAHFYDASALPTSVKDLCDWADALGCSLDFLAGRTENPKGVPGSGTTPEWHWDEEPPKGGRYLCLIDMKTGKLHESQCERSGGLWLAYGRPLDSTFSVEAWYPLPEKQIVRPYEFDEDEETEDFDE